MTIVTIGCIHGIIIIIIIIIIVIINPPHHHHHHHQHQQHYYQRHCHHHCNLQLVDINDTAGWLICKPVNGTLNKLKGLPTKDLQMFQMLHCPKMERRPDRTEGLYVQLLFFTCSCTFLYKQAEVGCLFFYLLLSCLIFLYMLLNSLFSGCFFHVPFILFFIFFQLYMHFPSMSLFTAVFIPEISIGICQPFPTLFQLCIMLLSAINTLLM